MSDSKRKRTSERECKQCNFKPMIKEKEKDGMRMKFKERAKTKEKK